MPKEHYNWTHHELLSPIVQILTQNEFEIERKQPKKSCDRSGYHYWRLRHYCQSVLVATLWSLLTMAVVFVFEFKEFNYLYLKLKVYMINLDP